VASGVPSTPESEAADEVTLFSKENAPLGSGNSYFFLAMFLLAINFSLFCALSSLNTFSHRFCPLKTK
jgi:hypothetical protein